MAKKLEQIELDVRKKAGNFIELFEASARHFYSDGSESKPYRVEFINRRGYDSVVAAVFYEEKGRAYLALRKQIRIPAAAGRTPGKARHRGGLYLLEAVAGSLEPGDKGKAKILKRAAAEVFEEAGFKVKPGDVISLGAPFYTSPGQSSEKIYPFAVRVEKGSALIPGGDGSLLERDIPPLKFYPLDEVIAMAGKGKIRDAKTEIAAIRLGLRLGLPGLGTGRRGGR